jgi:DNA-binding MarR family transcriptional regulator
MGLFMEKLDMELGENLRIMAQAMTEICQRSTLEKACPMPLTRNQFTILKILSNGNSIKIGTLARLLDISNPAVSKNIDRLALNGLVARRPNPNDRRRLEIILLSPGMAIVTEYERILGYKQKHLMEHFNQEEKAILLKLVKRVTRYTLAEEQDIEAICLQCGGNCGEDCVIEDRKGLCSLSDNNNAPEQISGAEPRGPDTGPDVEF